jgi:hypothetical protein
MAEGKPPAPPRKVERIKKARLKDGRTEYFVKFAGNDGGRGAWLSPAQIDPPSLIDAFRAKSRSDPPFEMSADPSVHEIKEIQGIIPQGDTWSFLVRFSDSNKDELLSRADMRARYPRQLVRFYESHLEHGDPITSLS